MPNDRLQQLYRQVVLAAAKPLATLGTVPASTPQHHAVNPSCGDALDLQLSVSAGRVEGLTVRTTGCTISQASATLMSQAVIGKTVVEADEQIRAFTAGVTAGDPMPEALGDAAVLAAVHTFPARVPCALLAWQALRQTLAEQEETNAGDEE